MESFNCFGQIKDVLVLITDTIKDFIQTFMALSHQKSHFQFLTFWNWFSNSTKWKHTKVQSFHPISLKPYLPWENNYGTIAQNLLAAVSLIRPLYSASQLIIVYVATMWPHSSLELHFSQSVEYWRCILAGQPPSFVLTTTKC